MDLFESRGIVVGCGVAGMVLRESDKHANTGIYFAAEDALCAGVLRVEPTSHAFLDILTTLPLNEDVNERQWTRVIAITWMVHNYITVLDADPKGLRRQYRRAALAS